jgi:GC-rich sequence DNA-binding factor
MSNISISFVFLHSSESIESTAKTLFDDALEDFTEMSIVREKFEDWKEKFGVTYREAYIALCIPKLVSPFVRLQMVSWNPVEVRRMVSDSAQFMLHWSEIQLP